MTASNSTPIVEVTHLISALGMDRGLFGPVIESFGPLPIHAQVEVANRLIRARGQYLCHRLAICDPAASGQANLSTRLKDIGFTAARLLQLLHRDGEEARPWNLHPAVTLALPQLCLVGSSEGFNQAWDPPHGLGQLGTMLSELAN